VCPSALAGGRCASERTGCVMSTDLFQLQHIHFPVSVDTGTLRERSLKPEAKVACLTNVGTAEHTLLWTSRNAGVGAACRSTMKQSIFPLPPIADPSQVQTLGEHIALGVDIRARCSSTGCNHNVALNLVVMARYLGVHHRARPEDLRPYFYCPDCRSAGLADENISFLYYACTAPHTLLCEAVYSEAEHLTAA